MDFRFYLVSSEYVLLNGVSFIPYIIFLFYASIHKTSIVPFHSLLPSMITVYACLICFYLFSPAFTSSDISETLFLPISDTLLSTVQQTMQTSLNFLIIALIGIKQSNESINLVKLHPGKLQQHYSTELLLSTPTHPHTTHTYTVHTYPLLLKSCISNHKSNHSNHAPAV